MSCNFAIHDELKNMEESTCPFCDQHLVEVDNNVRVVESCCSGQDIVNDLNCGSVHGYRYVNEYIDFMRICTKYGGNQYISSEVSY